MEYSRLGAWTRRRLGQLVGGLSASLLGFGANTETEARRRNKNKTKDKDRDKRKNRHKKRKKKRNKERCINLAKSCVPGHEACCNSLTCEDFGRPTGFRCCKGPGRACSDNRNDECCPELECFKGFCAFVEN